MKTILLIFALLFAHQSIAVAPYGFKGQDQTATQYSNVLKFKNRSVVKTGGINSLVEDQDNLLYNGGYEATPDLDGWTCVGAGSNFTIESKPVSASVVISGDRTLAIGCATVGGCTCTQDFSVNQQQIGRSVLLSGIVRTSSDVQGLKLTYRENGADTSVTTENVLNGIHATEAVIGSSAATIGIKLTIPYSATPLTVRVDEIKMAYGTAVTNQPAIGPEIPYTPTFTAFGVVSNVNFTYQQIGSNILIRGRFTTGTTTGATAGVSLPLGLTAAASIPSNKRVGGGLRDAGASSYTKNLAVLISPNTSTLGFSYADDPNSLAPLTPQLGSTIAGSGQVFDFEALVPIAQYASSVPTYTGRCNDPRACENDFSVVFNSSGVVQSQTFPSNPWIASCTSSSGGAQSCTYSSGLGLTTAMSCKPTIVLSGAGSISARVSSSTTTGFTVEKYTTTAASDTGSISISCSKQGVDSENAKTLQQNVALKSYVQTPNVSSPIIFGADISSTGVVTNNQEGVISSASCSSGNWTINTTGLSSIRSCYAIAPDANSLIPLRAFTRVNSNQFTFATDTKSGGITCVNLILECRGVK